MQIPTTKCLGDLSVRRRRNYIEPQVIGWRHTLDSIDIRLPKRDKSFTKQDINSFTSGAQLRILKMLSTAALLFLLFDLIHKFTVYEYTVRSIVPDLWLPIGMLVLLLLFNIFLRKIGHKLKYACIGRLAMVAYIIALLLYLLLFVNLTSLVKTYQASCFGAHRECLEYLGYSRLLDFNELMVFAVSIVLVAWMPLPPLLVFVSQVAVSSTLVSQSVYWDFEDRNSNIQLGILALLPRVLLSLGVTAFALHQERFLQIIMREESLIKEAAQEGHKNRILGLLGCFTKSENSTHDHMYHDMENPSQVSETSSENACVASPRSFGDLQTLKEKDVGEGTQGGIAETLTDLAVSKQVLTKDMCSEILLDASEDPVENQCSVSSVGALESSTMAISTIPSMPAAIPNWTYAVRNSFIEIHDPSVDAMCDRDIRAWTDERAGIEYKTYPELVGSSFVSRTPQSLSNEPHQHHRSSNLAENDGPMLQKELSSSSSDESVDVMVAPSNANCVGGGNKNRVFLSEYALVPRHPVTGERTSIGSIHHFADGPCTVCEWSQRGRTCKFGWRCPFCHILDGHTNYRRKRR